MLFFYHLIFFLSVNYLNGTNLSGLARLRSVGGRSVHPVMCNLGQPAHILNIRLDILKRVTIYCIRLDNFFVNVYSFFQAVTLVLRSIHEF